MISCSGEVNSTAQLTAIRFTLLYFTVTQSLLLTFRGVAWGPCASQVDEALMGRGLSFSGVGAVVFCTSDSGNTQSES